MSAMGRPAWATGTVEPDSTSGADPWHVVTVTVGEASINVSQIFDEEGPCPAAAVLDDDDVDMEWDAQGCRDFAAALLQAAALIEEADKAGLA